jgi:hypothetical protein
LVVLHHQEIGVRSRPHKFGCIDVVLSMPVLLDELSEAIERARHGSRVFLDDKL